MDAILTVFDSGTRKELENTTSSVCLSRGGKKCESKTQSHVLSDVSTVKAEETSAIRCEVC
jgi:hypothetical protein